MAIRTSLAMLALLFSVSGYPSIDAAGDDESVRTIRFPAPPHSHAIGTAVGSIQTSIQQVTLSPAASVHRYGLEYSEVRGVIEGIGWGGQTAGGTFLQAHYSYRSAYVLRIPPGWDGTLVVHRHGVAPIALWQALEAALADRNFARAFHETADRLVSDVALHPSRRWAFFAVNQTPIDPGGAFNTLVVPDDPSGGGTPVHSMLDVPIARDTAMLAQHLLRVLRGRTPDVTLGTGHSGGAFVNLMLNAGVDHLRTAAPVVLAGDNHLEPYISASGRIFDGFLSLAPGGPRVVPVDPVRGLSAPTLFLEGEVDMLALLAVQQVDDMIGKGLDVAGSNRMYMVRNVPHIDADLVSTINTHGTDFAGVLRLPPAFYAGGGERLKPVTAALLDALLAWTRHGIPPPTSIFNGSALDTDAVPGVDTVTFARTNSPDALAFPYVDDPALDAILAPPPVSTQNNVPLATRWDRVRHALGARTGSIVLPETACRRGGFTFISQGPVGTWFRPFDELAFTNAWGSSAAHQTCRAGVMDRLSEEGLYDQTVVQIDVQPRQFPNLIDLNSSDPLLVAVLSTAGFDATRLVPGSLRLAGSSLQGIARTPARVNAREEDVNGDGRADLVVEFEVERLQFRTHDMVAELWGWTKDGRPFSGSDIVKLVP
jgi:hypothetical protein